MSVPEIQTTASHFLSVNALAYVYAASQTTSARCLVRY